MANDCLVVNLESEIDDPTLPVLGAMDCEIIFTGTPTDEIVSFQFGVIGSGCPIEVLDNGNFYSGYSGDSIGKKVTKTGSYSQNRIYFKPEVYTRPVKIRIKDAFNNINQFGGSEGDWAGVFQVFLRSNATAVTGWILVLPSDIVHVKNLISINRPCMVKDTDKVDFTKLQSLRVLFLIDGIYYSENSNFSLIAPDSIERLAIGGIAVNSPGVGSINFDLATANKLRTFEATNPTTNVSYTGSGTILSTNIIGYWLQAMAFPAANTTQFDLYLQALSLCSFSSGMQVRVAGTRTSASDTAVATLVSKLPGRFYINGVVQS